MAYDDEPKDPRIRATQSVWGIACGMMGISIPLIAITGGAGGMSYLPLMVIAGAAASSLAIWFAPQREKTYIESAPIHELEDIKRGILDLRDYIGSLEQKIEDQELQLRITQAGTGNQETKNPSSSPT